jgi:uncharacterized membrane protein
MEQRHGLALLTQRTRTAVVTSYGLLILLLLVGGALLQANTDSGWTPVLVRVLPLILFLPTIISRRPRGHAWLAFVSLLYFMQGVMVASLPGQFLLGALEIIASLALFASTMLYARWRSRELRA